MNTPLSEAEAFGILETRREMYAAAMAPVLRRAGADVAAAETGAVLLTDMMIGVFRNEFLSQQVARDVPRKLIVAFGDSLVPSLKDLIDAPPVGFLARCVDTYWKSASSALEAA